METDTVTRDPGGLTVGDTVVTFKGKIGGHDVEVYSIVDSVKVTHSGDTVYTYRSAGSGYDALGRDVTINNTCLLDLIHRRMVNHRLISYGCHGGLGAAHRLRTKPAIEEYLGGFRTGNTVSLTFDGDDEAALYSELASDNMFLGAALGFGRLGFGALVSAAENAAAEEAEGGEAATTEDQFFQGGGNATVYLAIPTYYFRNFAVPMADEAPQFVRRADIFTTFMVGADVPNMGTAVEDPAMNARAGLQGTFVQSTMANIFNFFLHLDATAGWGSSQFFDNLGVDASGWEQIFGVIQAEAGFDLNQLLRVGLTVGNSTMGARMSPRLSVKLLKN